MTRAQKERIIDMLGYIGDLDGIDNLGEYLSDTIPTNINSVLAITAITRDADVTVSWKGGTGATQYLQRAEDVLSAMMSGRYSAALGVW